MNRNTARLIGGCLAGILILGGGPAAARPVPSSRVATAVATWLQSSLSKGIPNARVLDLTPYPDAAQPAAYIAHLAGGGYCLAGADDRLLPVTLYAPTGDYDPADPEPAYILELIRSGLERLERNDPALAPFAAELAARAAVWEDLGAGRVPARRPAPAADTVPTRLELPVRSAWAQGPPYNADVAVLPGYGAAATGCVATAMSQLMYFWKWPLTGTGSHTRTWEYRTSSTWETITFANDPGIDEALWGDRLRWLDLGNGSLQMTGNWDYSTFWRVKEDTPDPQFQAAMDLLWEMMTPVFVDHSADFGAATYDWDLMGDRHHAPWNLGAAADAEAAELMHHAGISVNMLWGLQVSYAGSSDIPSALTSYFRYDPDVVFGPLTDQNLIDELLWHRPVPVDGVVPPGGGGGHSWLVTGYDLGPATGPVFQMNLGWGGEPVWLAFDLVSQNYGQVQRAAPLGAVHFVGGGLAGDGSPGSPHASLAMALLSVPDHTTLVLHAGSNHSLGAPTVLDKPLVFLGEGAVIH